MAGYIRNLAQAAVMLSGFILANIAAWADAETEGGPDWRAVQAELLAQGKCTQANNLLFAIHDAKFAVLPEDIARHETVCPKVHIVLTPPKPLTSHIERNSETEAYWDACGEPVARTQPDAEAAQRAINRARGLGPGHITERERKARDCSHRALRRAIAAEQAAGGDASRADAELWFREARMQDSAAADFAWAIRVLDGRIPLSADLDVELLEDKWNLAAERLLFAALKDFPPAYIPAARLILEDQTNPYGEYSEIIESEFLSNDALAVCLLYRAQMYHEDRPDRPAPAEEVKQTIDAVTASVPSYVQERGWNSAASKSWRCGHPDELQLNSMLNSRPVEELLPLEQRQAWRLGDLTEF